MLLLILFSFSGNITSNNVLIRWPLSQFVKSQVFRCKVETRSVKTWRSSCFIRGAGLTGWAIQVQKGGEQRVSSLSFSSCCLQQRNWTGTQRKEVRRGGDCLYFFLSKAKQKQTHKFPCHYGVSFEILGVNLPTVPYSGQTTGWSITNSANNLSVKVRRKLCVRELPQSTFPKEWWNFFHGVTTFFFLLTIIPWSMRMCLELLILEIVFSCSSHGSDIIPSKCITTGP